MSTFAPHPNALGDLMRRQRAKLNLSHRQLARCLRPPVHHSFVSRVELGLKRLPPTRWSEICHILEISEKELREAVGEAYWTRDGGKPRPEKPAPVPVSLGDMGFVQAVYEKYSRAMDPKRQAFEKAVKDIFGVKKGLPLPEVGE